MTQPFLSPEDIKLLFEVNGITNDTTFLVDQLGAKANYSIPFILARVDEIPQVWGTTSTNEAEVRWAVTKRFLELLAAEVRRLQLIEKVYTQLLLKVGQ